MLYYIVIFWLIGGLVFDAVMTNAAREVTEASPLMDGAVSVLVFLTWPFVLTIGLVIGSFYQWRNGGL